tara:strand:- start:3250 stop:8364 length:5115 start_codon:yes stop_codon:yes gene_type:complete
MTTTASTQEFRVRVHDYGTLVPITATVDFTWTALGEYPAYGAQNINLLRGEFVTTPWEVSVVDASNAVINNMATGGRMDLIGRIAEIQENRDSAGWATVATGRLTRMTQQSDVKTFSVQISDERWVEQRATLFTEGGTTSLYPAGPIGRFKGWSTYNIGSTGAAYAQVTETSGDRTRIRIAESNDNQLKSSIVQWIQADVVADADQTRTDGSGNFNHLRMRLQGVDYQVLALSEKTVADLSVSGSVTELVDEAFLEAAADDEITLTFSAWIYTPGGLPIAAQSQGYRGWLYAPSAPPSTVLPLHVGATDSGSKWDAASNSWALVTAIYDEIGVRYDQTAFDDLENSTAVWMDFRITSPVKDVRAWLNKHVYAPLLVAPFIDSQGRVSPRSMRTPTDESFLGQTIYYDWANSFVFDEGLLKTAPSWEYGNDAISVVVVEYKGLEFAKNSLTSSADNMKVIEAPDDEFTSDRVAQLGRHSVVYNGDGLWRTSSLLGTYSGFFEYNNPDWVSVANRRTAQMQYLADNVFARYGDGSITGRFDSLKFTADGTGRTPLDDVYAGDYVVLDVGTFPNPQTPSMGARRVVQIVSKAIQKDSIRWEYLDVGPDLQPLVAPTIASLVTTAASPKHSVTVTMSGIPAGATATLWIGIGAGTTFNRIEAGVANAVATIIPDLPANTLIRVRAMSEQDKLIGSSWSAESTVTTAAISPPTGLTSAVSGTSIQLNWTVGDPDYRTEVQYKKNADADWITARVDPLREGSNWFLLNLDSPSTAYDFRVFHVDKFQGESAAATLLNISTSTAVTLGAPRSLQFRQARTSTTDTPDALRVIGIGYEIGWRMTEPESRIFFEVDATDSTFANVIQEGYFLPTTENGFIFLASLNETTHYVRIRHENPSKAPSAWSSVISAKMVELVESSVATDRFAGGFAYGDEYANGDYQLNVGHGDDPDTDGAYYAVVLNPVSPDLYPTVTTASAFVPRADMPEVTTVNGPPNPLVLTPGDVVLLTVRFWNATAGFGQTTQHRYAAPATTATGISISDFRETARSSTTVKYEWTADVNASWVYVYDNSEAQPVTADPWGSGALTTLEVGVDAQEYTVTIPPPGYVAYLQFEVKDAALTTDQIIQVLTPPLAEEPDWLHDLEIEVNQQDGSVRVRVEANPAVESYRYAFAVAAETSPPAYPSDATVEAGTIRTMVGVVATDEFTLPAGTVTLGEMVRIRACGYILVTGLGTDGATDHGPFLSIEKVRTRFRHSNLQATTQSERVPTATEARFGVTHHDPDGLSDKLEYRTKTDPDGAWTGWSLETNTPADAVEYLTDVTMLEGHLVFVQFRLTYTIGGSVIEITETSPGFDFGTSSSLSVIPHIDEDGRLSAQVSGDVDTKSIRILAGATAPLAANVRLETAKNGTSFDVDDIGTLLTIGLGESGFVSAFGYTAINGGGNESTILEVTKVTRAGAFAPRVDEEWIREGSTTAALDLGISDPYKTVTAVEFNKREGSETGDVFLGWLSSWDRTTGVLGTDAALTRGEDVLVPEGEDSAVMWRVTYTDENGATQQVGGGASSSNPDEHEVTLQFPATSVVPVDDLQSFEYSAGNILNPRLLNSDRFFILTTVLPVGVTITGVGARYYRLDANQTAVVSFKRLSNIGAGTTLATLTHASTGWVTAASGTLAETVSSPNVYAFAVTLQSQTASNRSGLMYCSVTFTRHNQNEKY